jgi:hypothetical protein
MYERKGKITPYVPAAIEAYATNRKVAGNTPGEVIGILNWSNPSSRNIVLGFTAPRPQLRPRNLVAGGGGKARPTFKADNLADICEPIVHKMFDPRRLKTIWASTVSYRDSLTCYF